MQSNTSFHSRFRGRGMQVLGLSSRYWLLILWVCVSVDVETMTAVEDAETGIEGPGWDAVERSLRVVSEVRFRQALDASSSTTSQMPCPPLGFELSHCVRCWNPWTDLWGPPLWALEGHSWGKTWFESASPGHVVHEDGTASRLIYSMKQGGGEVKVATGDCLFYNADRSDRWVRWNAKVEILLEIRQTPRAQTTHKGWRMKFRGCDPCESVDSFGAGHQKGSPGPRFGVGR